MLTANYEYCHINRENMLLPIQMQFSKKSKIFSGLFYSRLESTLNFQCFKTKMNVVGQIFLKLLTLKEFKSYLNP